MSAGTTQYKVSRADWTIADPGDGGAIPVGRTGVCLLTSAGAETRTIADPEKVGIQLSLAHQTDGGAITVTVATAFNEAGNTTLTFNDPGEYAKLESVMVSTTAYAWRPVSIDGATAG